MQAKYRHELKYSIDYADYLELRPRLRAVMCGDKNVRGDGTYLINSIYFDNYGDKALREKMSGVQTREKWRIRWYNDSLEKFKLEKKMKHNSLCMKFSAPLDRAQCEKILAGDIDWMMSSDNGLIPEFYFKLRSQLLKPRVLVSYKREPYVYAPGNVRVTFDSDIHTSVYDTNFLAPETRAPAVDDRSIILEVKYDEYLPSIISEIIQLGRVRQRAFSKYGACRKFG
ncbi:MAG: polyphosphate polymerase domain-containing protein [Oscillospiraceae bacterium]|nr:polyphosphate polymerase domain-containing protein [Oscillospiraceae bacterium]